MVVDVAAPGRISAKQANDTEPRTVSPARHLGAQHAEHQRDEKESGEAESGVRSAVDDEKHREHGGKKLESGQAGIRKPQIEPRWKRMKKARMAAATIAEASKSVSRSILSCV